MAERDLARVAERQVEADRGHGRHRPQAEEVDAVRLEPERRGDEGVAPAEPTSGSVKHPAPMMGESPTRPGIFHANPDVVVVPLGNSYLFPLPEDRVSAASAFERATASPSCAGR